MKRILMIAAKLDTGGAEKVEADIGLYADPARFDVHYVVFGGETGVYEQKLRSHGCRIFHMPPPSAGYRAYMLNLRRLAETYRYDVIHAHTMFSAGWAMLAGRLCGIPVRVAHAHSALAERRSLKVRLYEAAMRALILSCATDYAACGVAAGERLYGRRVFERRGRVLLNGVDTRRFAYAPEMREECRKRLGVRERLVIGHAGHFAAVKNQAFLIGLMPEILKKRPDALLLLLGDGEDRPELESMTARLGLEEHILTTGNVENVEDYLCAMDAFAFPSLYEGTPLALIEAQSNGLPCIVSDRVPRDAFLTELVRPLPLERPSEWVEALCAARRAEPEKYAEAVRRSGFDVSSAMERIYVLYEGER